MKNSQEINKAVEETPRLFRNCVIVCLNEIEREEREHGEFASVDDFIDRMLAAHMDIHGFTVAAKYLPLRFPGNGDAGMLRAVLALRGYDPDYMEAPRIQTYVKYPADEDPFN